MRVMFTKGEDRYLTPHQLLQRAIADEMGAMDIKVRITNLISTETEELGAVLSPESTILAVLRDKEDNTYCTVYCKLKEFEGLQAIFNTY